MRLAPTYAAVAQDQTCIPQRAHQMCTPEPHSTCPVQGWLQVDSRPLQGPTHISVRQQTFDAVLCAGLSLRRKISCKHLHGAKHGSVQQSQCKTRTPLVRCAASNTSSSVNSANTRSQNASAPAIAAASHKNHANQAEEGTYSDICNCCSNLLPNALQD